MKKIFATTLWLSLLGWVSSADAQLSSADGVAEIQYDIVFNQETALEREIHVEMSFDVLDDDPVALSLPSWTPGSYELDDYAQNIHNLWARQNGAEIHWDKADFDTWRVHPTMRGRVTIGFDYSADALDTGASWSQPDFAFFNGTNVFLYPEGSDLSFESKVAFHTEDDWQIATGFTPDGTAGEYTVLDYHELVDMPTFVGRFDLDSLQIGRRWYRLATYPQGTMIGQAREVIWDQIVAMMPPMEKVFGDVPWDHYTTLMVFDSGFGGGSALEHSNSHLGIYSPAFLLSPTLASITAHEIFHAWNVKRLRPADLWPYDYARRIPTELLWISEGVTDYYADLALVRGEIIPPESFYGLTQGKIDNVNSTVPVALEDASLSAWISPRDGTSSIYYPKGSLAGLMLDILIRDASDNEMSLDDVMKKLYEDAYLRDRGFTEVEWWAAVQEVSGGLSFEDFQAAYVDGRESYPWNDILPLAGLRLRTETQRVPRIGISTSGSDEGVEVVTVVPGGAGNAAGVQAGDILISVAGIDVSSNTFGEIFRQRFANEQTGVSYDMVVARNGVPITLSTELQFAELTSSQIEENLSTNDKARRVLEGLLTGSTGR